MSHLDWPLGMIVKVLGMHYGDEAPVIGSLNTLYNGVANLDCIHFYTKDAKEELLILKSKYECEMDNKLRFFIKFGSQPTSSDFTKSAAHNFLISDDLRVLPNGASSIIDTLSHLGIDLVDMDGANTSYVTLGLNEASLVYRNPLSALLLPGSQMKLATANSKQGNTVLSERAISANNKKMILKVMIQKSCDKLLFAQADDHEFINFLFGMLNLSLRNVERYLGSHTGLQNMDNLYERILTDGTFSYATPNAFSPLNFNPKLKQCHVKESRMYMVSDDLTVTPLDLFTGLSILNGLKISLSDVKEIEVQVGLEEGLNILKAALTSTTALTDGLIKPMLKKQSKQEK